MTNAELQAARGKTATATGFQPSTAATPAASAYTLAPPPAATAVPLYQRTWFPFAVVGGVLLVGGGILVAKRK